MNTAAWNAMPITLFGVTLQLGKSRSTFQINTALRDTQERLVDDASLLMQLNGACLSMSQRFLD